jgi:hypothetical protein
MRKGIWDDFCLGLDDKIDHLAGEPLYCGPLRNLVKYTVYSDVFISGGIWDIERCPYYGDVLVGRWEGFHCTR